MFILPVLDLNIMVLTDTFDQFICTLVGHTNIRGCRFPYTCKVHSYRIAINSTTNYITVKHFHWDTVYLELQHKITTLLSLLEQIVKRPSLKRPLLCALCSQLLNSQHQHMGLVQRAISIMLYGNGTAKQVSFNSVPKNGIVGSTTDLLHFLSDLLCQFLSFCTWSVSLPQLRP